MTEDPWKNLTPPSAANAINAKRVDAEAPWGFFWARGIDGDCLFVIQHSVEATPTSRLPRLQGVEVSDSEWLDGHSRILIFRLEDSAQRDLFHQLCLDIVSCAAQAPTEREAVRLSIARTWRWHHLLRGGGDHRLSPEEQKGLIGELLVIERHLLPHIGCADAVSAWGGPLGAPKDFAIGRGCIEVKARRGAAPPHVKISSESQLDESDIGALLLYVVDLDRAPSDAPGCFSLNEVALRVRDMIAGLDQGALEAFEGLLAASGFRWADDYTDVLWLEGAHRVYRVTDGFPRITASQLCAGVSEVRYSILLTECQPYLTGVDALESLVKGESDGV
jgi:hypothetical protein